MGGLDTQGREQWYSAGEQEQQLKKQQWDECEGWIFIMSEKIGQFNFVNLIDVIDQIDPKIFYPLASNAVTVLSTRDGSTHKSSEFIS